MRGKVFLVTDDNVSWVLDEVNPSLFHVVLRSNAGKASIMTLLVQHVDRPLVSTPPC